MRSAWTRFVVAQCLVLFPASAAHAQRIPDAAIWWVGASLLAPFIAVPIKLGILRLRALEVAASRLWALAAMEWTLWFPVGFLLLRYNRSSPPVVFLLLLAAVVWLHRIRVSDATWSSALYLSLPTPALAISLPFLVFALHGFLERLAA